MAQNLFSGARASSPVPSEPEMATSAPARSAYGAAARPGAGYASGVGDAAGVGGASVRREVGGVMLKGRGPVLPDPRKMRYDAVRGRAMALGFEVSREDRMSAKEAGDTMVGLWKMFGIEGENEGVLSAFENGLFFCHTVNGASTLVDGRSTFAVPGVTEVFSYANVRDSLGTSMRRFFRAYADEIAAVNKRVLRMYDPHDPVSTEQYAWLMEVANDRGLHRYPYLSHDSADACTGLNASERAALSASKALVVSSVVNSADRMKNNSRVISADRYDSTSNSTF